MTFEIDSDTEPLAKVQTEYLLPEKLKHLRLGLIKIQEDQNQPDK